MASDGLRRGERALPFDPADTADDARLQFIGRIRSPWVDSAACPRNLRVARERGLPATVEVDLPFRAGLEGLEGFSHLVLLYWLDRARRDLLVQAPKGAGGQKATFAIRSPVRPNPIGLAVVNLMAVEIETGRIGIDAIDCIDGTPLLDIKPYLPAIDAFPEARTGERRQ